MLITIQLLYQLSYAGATTIIAEKKVFIKWRNSRAAGDYPSAYRDLSRTAPQAASRSPAMNSAPVTPAVWRA